MGAVIYKPKSKNIVKLKKFLNMNWVQTNTGNITVEYKTSKYSFVCLDRTLRKAAQKEGFQVLPEGPLEDKKSGS